MRVLALSAMALAVRMEPQPESTQVSLTQLEKDVQEQQMIEQEETIRFAEEFDVQLAEK